ncbi:MAG: FMN-binding negative transcriptional regulator, partial [SAR324 cluster bacterium]|nr:FMN-binding negative transcriptional regulator [SAR324 cluster bacterium]
NGDQVPEVSHLPLYLKTGLNHDRILGHLALANPQAAWIENDKPALAVFSGVDSYISPRWYVDENQVPTWNYQVVHAHGTLRRIDEPSELMRLLEQLTKQHESDAENPWSADWDNPKISRLLKAIVGFELTVEHWEGKSKLGQNRDFQDRESLKVHLQNSEDASRNKLAEVMK